VTEEQRSKIANVMSEEHVAVIATLGEVWPTATLEAFAETPELDLVIIMNDKAERVANIARNPHVSFLVVNRYGEIARFQVKRLSGRGVAHEVESGSEEWERLKKIFLAKNPFEEPFFGNPALKMFRIKPISMKYADGLQRPFSVEL
jgi:nitroimidazol reductase NimA-like FMN-containing flavoprotein (pyridoxamine 5'-phosphate oxidase superfamily)